MTRSHAPKLTTRLQRYSGLLAGPNTKPAAEDGLLAWEAMVWNMHTKDNYSESEPRVPIYKVNEGREPPRELDADIESMRSRFFDLRTNIKQQMARGLGGDDAEDSDDADEREEAADDAGMATEDGWVEISDAEAAEAAYAEAAAETAASQAAERAAAAPPDPDTRQQVPRETLFVSSSSKILASEPPDEELSANFSLLRDSLRGMKPVRPQRPLEGLTPVSIRPAANAAPDYVRMTANLSAGGFRPVPAVAASPKSSSFRSLKREVDLETASASEGIASLLRDATATISALGAEGQEPLTFAALQSRLRSQQRQYSSPFGA